MTDQPHDSHQDIDISALQAYTHDLTAIALSAAPLHAHEYEVLRILEILGRPSRHKCHPMLIGEPDEIRSAIVTEVIRRVAMVDVPDGIRVRQVVELDVDALIIGTTGREELAFRFREVLWHIGLTAGRTLVFVNDFDRIADSSGKANTTDIANILKPTLNRTSIQFFGTATLANYRRCIEKEASLQRHFQELTVRIAALST